MAAVHPLRFVRSGDSCMRAGALAHGEDFRLVAAGVGNMFPYTAYVESIVLFDR
jgi:hypothetical protein